MPMTSDEFVKSAIESWKDRANWTYCHGAIGKPEYYVGSVKVKNLYEYFLQTGKNSTNIPYAEWEKEHKGKFCCDCSNWINYLMGFTVSAWSTQSFALMEKVAGPMPGAICYKSGHVGIAISADEFIHMPYYQRTFERVKFADLPGMWESFHKLPATYVTYPEHKDAYPVAIHASLKKAQYPIGTKLTSSDFYVSVDMSDKSSITTPNLQNWKAYPLVIEGIANSITVEYNGLKTIAKVAGGDYPTEITAKLLNGPYAIGTQLTAADFYVAVKMASGALVPTPILQKWSASPTLISKKNQKITVSWHDISTVITASTK